MVLARSSAPSSANTYDAGGCAFFGRPAQHEQRIRAVAVEPGRNP
jgi:hypothetical protein